MPKKKKQNDAPLTEEMELSEEMLCEFSNGKGDDEDEEDGE